MKVFEPTKPGAGWPYSVLMGVGACAMLWEANDLYQLSQSVGHRDRSIFWFIGGCIAICGLMLGAAWAFWYYPWSRATVTVSDQGLTLSIKGLGKRPETTFVWSDIAEFDMMELPRGASTFGWTLRSGTRIAVRTASLNADPADVFLSAQAQLTDLGCDLDGPNLTAPLIGPRRWKIIRTQT